MGGFKKQKNPPPRGSGLIKCVIESKPYCDAEQQRQSQQQV
jgi:hypothetical protein